MNDIDKRVVQMQFDNSQFEAGIQQTLKSLLKLDESLGLPGADKGLEKVASASKKVPPAMNSVEESVLKVQVAFSTMQMVGLSAINRLTNEAIDLGKKITNALWSPILEGGKRRALNIQNAKFMLEGLKVAWEDISEDINYAVAGTAYSLDSAAKVAASLVASGVEVGDQMALSLRAVSGLAAMTNSSYEEIGDIFTTIAGNGKLMTMQLRQLSSRGMNAAAELAKAMNTTEQAIYGMVTRGEISFGEFAEAMYNAFGEHAVQANKTFTGSLSNIKAALAKIGAEFADPVYTESVQVFNSIRVAINKAKSVLMNLGVVDVWKQLVSYASDWVSTLIDSQGFIYTVAYALNDVWSYLKVIGYAFKDAFQLPNAATVMFQFTDFVRSLELTGENAQTVYSVLKGIFRLVGDITKTLLRLIGAVAPILPKIFNVLIGIINAMLRILDMANDTSTPLGAMIKQFKEIAKMAIAKMFDTIANAIKRIDWNKVAKAIGAIIVLAAKLLPYVVKGFELAVNGVVWLINNFDRLGIILAGVLSTIGKFVGMFGANLLSLFGGASSFNFSLSTSGLGQIPVIGQLTTLIDNLIGKTNQATDSINELSEAEQNAQATRDTLARRSGYATGGGLGAFNDSVVPDVTGKLNKLTNNPDEIKRASDEDAKNITTALEDTANAVREQIHDQADRINDAQESASEQIQNGAKGLFTQLAEAFGFDNTILGAAFKAIDGFFGGIKKAFTIVVNYVKQSIVEFLGSFDGREGFGFLDGVVVTLAGLIGLLYAATAPFRSIAKGLIGTFTGSSASSPFSAIIDDMLALGVFFKDLAISFAIFAASMRLLVDENTMTNIMTLLTTILDFILAMRNTIVVVVSIIFELAPFFDTMTSAIELLSFRSGNVRKRVNRTGQLKEFGFFLLETAASLWIIVKALENIASIPDSVFFNGALRLGAIAFGLFVLTGIMSVIAYVANDKGALSGGFSGNVSSTSATDWRTILTGLPTVTASRDVKYENPLGGLISYLITFSASLAILTHLVTKLGSSSTDVNFGKGIARLAALSGMLVVLSMVITGLGIAASSMSQNLTNATTGNIVEDVENKFSRGGTPLTHTINTTGPTTNNTQHVGKGDASSAIKQIGNTILKISASFLILEHALSKIAGISDDVFLKGYGRMWALTGMIIALMGAVAFFTGSVRAASPKIGNINVGTAVNNVDSIGKTILSVTISIAILAGICSNLARGTTEKELNTGLKTLWSLSGMVIALVAAIGIFTGQFNAFKIDAKFSQNAKISSTLMVMASIVGAMVALTVSVVMIARTAGDPLVALGFIGTIVGATIAIVSATVGMIFVVSKIPVDKIVKTIAILATMTVFVSVVMSCLVSIIKEMAPLKGKTDIANAMAAGISSIGSLLVQIAVSMLLLTSIKADPTGYVSVILSCIAMIAIIQHGVIPLIKSLGDVKATGNSALLVLSVVPLISAVMLLSALITKILESTYIFTPQQVISLITIFTGISMILLSASQILKAASLATRLDSDLPGTIGAITGLMSALMVLSAGASALLGAMNAEGLMGAGAVLIMNLSLSSIIETMSHIVDSLSGITPANASAATSVMWEIVKLVSALAVIGPLLGSFAVANGVGSGVFLIVMFLSSIAADAIVSGLERLAPVLNSIMQTVTASPLITGMQEFTTTILALAASAPRLIIMMLMLNAVLPTLGTGLASVGVAVGIIMTSLGVAAAIFEVISNAVQGLIDQLTGSSTNGEISIQLEITGQRLDRVNGGLETLNEKLLLMYQLLNRVLSPALTRIVPYLRIISDWLTRNTAAFVNTFKEIQKSVVDATSSINVTLLNEVVPTIQTATSAINALTAQLQNGLTLIDSTGGGYATGGGSGRFNRSSVRGLANRGRNISVKGDSFVPAGDGKRFYKQYDDGTYETDSFGNRVEYDSQGRRILSTPERLGTGAIAVLGLAPASNLVGYAAANISSWMNGGREFISPLSYVQTMAAMGTSAWNGVYGDELKWSGVQDLAQNTPLADGGKGVIVSALAAIGIDSDTVNEMMTSLNSISDMDFGTGEFDISSLGLDTLFGTREDPEIRAQIDAATARLATYERERQESQDIINRYRSPLTGEFNDVWYYDEQGRQRRYTSDRELASARAQYNQAAIRTRNYDRIIAAQNATIEDLNERLFVATSIDDLINWGGSGTDFSDVSWGDAGGFGGGTTSGMADDISKTSGLGSGINDTSASITQVNSNNTFTFTQNNYSPESLSRTDIYKQTRSQLQDWTGFMRARPSY